MAFITGPALPSTSGRTARGATIVCSQQRPDGPSTAVSRRQLLVSAAIAAAGALSSSVSSPAANAADATGLERAISKALFPKEGFNAPDSVLPDPKKINREIMSKPEVKSALAKIEEYQKKVGDLYTKFKDDPQAELSALVKDAVPIDELRNALNTVNEAIDENTQFETDKVVRGIIQDINELEVASDLKPGIERTQKKIDRTVDWFEKIGGDFTRLLSFYGDDNNK